MLLSAPAEGRREAPGGGDVLADDVQTDRQQRTDRRPFSLFSGVLCWTKALLMVLIKGWGRID